MFSYTPVIVFIVIKRTCAMIPGSLKCCKVWKIETTSSLAKKINRDMDDKSYTINLIIRQYLKFAELVHFFRLLPRLVFVVSCRGSVKRDIRLAISGHILPKLRGCAVRSEKDTSIESLEVRAGHLAWPHSGELLCSEALSPG